MHILLTNDDGITSPGLWAAARALATLGSIVIVAPNRDYSGYGTAIPPQEEISLTRYQQPEADWLRSRHTQRRRRRRCAYRSD